MFGHEPAVIYGELADDCNCVMPNMVIITLVLVSQWAQNTQGIESVSVKMVTNMKGGGE